MSNAFDPRQQAHRVGESGSLAWRQIDLAGVAGHHHATVFAEPGQQHFHLHRRRVLGFIQDNGGVRQGPPAHEGERCDLDFSRLQSPLDDARIH